MTRSQPGQPDLNATQKRVHAILLKADGPLSAYAVLDQMRAEGPVTPPTVYRSLDRLIDCGLVHRLESLNAYVACRHEHEHGSLVAFAICESCGTTTEFTDSAVDTRLKAWSDRTRFHPSRTTIEIRGTCAACAA